MDEGVNKLHRSIIPSVISFDNPPILNNIEMDEDGTVCAIIKVSEIKHRRDCAF